MKGFKKDGKFRPTGNKSKSALKKSDVRRKTTMPKQMPNDAGTYYAEKTDGTIIKMELTSKEATKIMKGFHNGIAKEKGWKSVEVDGRHLEHMYGIQEEKRDKQSVNEVESVCGLCDDPLIIPDVDDEEVKIDDNGTEYVDVVEECHQDCFENTYGAYDSYEDYITTEAKKRGISEKELQNIIDHEHGYDRDDILDRALKEYEEEFDKKELDERMEEINSNLRDKIENKEMNEALGRDKKTVIGTEEHPDEDPFIQYLVGDNSTRDGRNHESRKIQISRRYADKKTIEVNQTTGQKNRADKAVKEGTHHHEGFTNLVKKLKKKDPSLSDESAKKIAGSIQQGSKKKFGSKTVSKGGRKHVEPAI